MPPTLVMWIHLLAAASWIGGLLFYQIVFRPMASQFPGIEGEPLQMLEERFRALRWTSLLLLLATGVFNLIHEGNSARLESDWGVFLLIKLVLVAVAIGLTLVQDFLIGPSIKPSENAPSRVWLGRAILLTALAIFWAAVYLRQTL